MNAKTRIKVDRDLLVARIRANQVVTDAAYAEALAAYTKAEKAYPKRVADYLADLGRKVRAGEVTPSDALSDSWHGYAYDHKPKAPRKPDKPRDVTLAIAQLEMASDMAITITTEDFARYMA